MLQFPTMPGDRFLIKIASADSLNNRRTRQIGVGVINQKLKSFSLTIYKIYFLQIAITNDNQFRKLPELPTNRTIYKISSISSCRSVWIAWNSSPDTRDIQYCITLVRLEKRNSFIADNPFASNICDTLAPVIDHPNFSQMHCFPSHRIDIEKFELTNLSIDCRYLVHVFVRLNGITLYYDMLEIMTNRYCINEFVDDDDNDDETDSDLDIDRSPNTQII